MGDDKTNEPGADGAKVARRKANPAWRDNGGQSSGRTGGGCGQGGGRENNVDGDKTGEPGVKKGNGRKAIGQGGKRRSSRARKDWTDNVIIKSWYDFTENLENLLLRRQQGRNASGKGVKFCRVGDTLSAAEDRGGGPRRKPHNLRAPRGKPSAHVEEKGAAV